MAKHYAPRDILGHLMRPRTLVYSSILFAIIAAATWSLATRIPLKVDILRDRSTLYREADDEKVENVFTLRIMNTDEQDHRYAMRVDGVEGIEIVGDQSVDVPAASSKNLLVVASVKDGSIPKGSSRIFFDIRADDQNKIAVREKTTFYMP